MPVRSLFGAAMGYCVGTFIKKMEKKIAMYMGMGIVSLAFLAKMNYVTINWKQIDQDLY